MSVYYYVEYSRCLTKYQKIEEEYDQLWDEREELFERTQPKSVDYKKERVNSQSTVNSNDSYLIAVERRRIDEKLKRYKDALKDKKERLTAKESQLRASKNRYDVVFCKNYLDCMKISQIAKELNYSHSQVWRMLKSIQNRIEKEV